MMDCKKCEDLTQWYREKNPGNMGRGMCPECYEKSKEHFIYLDLRKQPYGEVEGGILSPEWRVNLVNKEKE